MQFISIPVVCDLYYIKENVDYEKVLYYIVGVFCCRMYC